MRISLTFRKTRLGPCECVYKTLCDSVNTNIIENDVASKLEEVHVHQVLLLLFFGQLGWQTSVRPT